MGKTLIAHLTKKDFKLDWFSGTGAGGQNRNKTQNCLRLTHIESGFTVTAQNERDRSGNQRVAMERMAVLLKEYYSSPKFKKRFNAVEEIRAYREPDNLVIDRASGKTSTYKEVVKEGNIGTLIEDRKMALDLRD